MAAATENQSHVQNSQDILREVRKFIRGANYEDKVSSDDLAQSALYLLRTLPAARHAVLEYLCNVFTESVNTHLLHIELGSAVAVPEGPSYDGVIKDATGVLLSFVRSTPGAWAPIISSWSLELLGQISSKYSERRGVPHSSSLNEVLQLWMTCPATKALIEIATECFDAMVSGAPDVCVDSLLEASVKYSPYFDWVVAHIGSCFPNTIITRVLMCGQKDFCAHAGSQSMPESSTTEDKTPKMASVVGILGHLASKHGQDIRRSLMALFQESLTADSDLKKLSTVPFLLQLASMSPMLLNVLTTDFVKSLSPEVLNRLHHQFSEWKSTKLGDYDSMLSLVVHLVMKSDVGAYQVFQFLFHVAYPLDPLGPKSMECVVCRPEVQSVCVSVLQQLCCDLQKAVFNRKHSSVEIPFLSSLSSHALDVTKELLQSPGQRGDWILRILGYVCLYSGLACSADVLAYILTESRTAAQRSKFIELQVLIETRLEKVLSTTLERVVNVLQPNRSTHKAEVLSNLLNVVKWERRSSAQESNYTRGLLYKTLHQHVGLFTTMLNHPDDAIGIATLELIQAINIPPSLTGGLLLNLCCSITAIFFRALEKKDTKIAVKVLRLCKNCILLLCGQSFAQSLILKNLIEGTLSMETRELFGGKIDLTAVKSGDGHQMSLYDENRRHGLSLTLPQSHSSVFHAGVIGKGLKPRAKPPTFSKEQILRNKNFLLDILWLASSNPTRFPDTSRSSGETSMEVEQGEITPATSQSVSGPSAMIGRKLANLMTELLMPDVLYNSIAWPEEEFLRVTIERDLHVQKQLDENPVLWDITELLSCCQMFVCFLSPVLRSLTGTLMTHFDNSRESSARNSPKQLECACKLVYCLKKGRMLPFPLSNIGEVFPCLAPYEIHLLLLTIWRYIKENPPRLDGPPADCEPRYLEVLRAMLHKNIDKVGSFYSRMFDNSASGKS